MEGNVQYRDPWARHIRLEEGGHVEECLTHKGAQSQRDAQGRRIVNDIIDRKDIVTINLCTCQ